MLNDLLCICIPTYNRADKLDETLTCLIHHCEKYRLPICVSDNNSSDHTADIVQKHKDKYPWIHFSSNVSNVGPDKNFESALKMSNCDYSWLLGDDDMILFSEFSSVLDILTNDKLDFLIVNTKKQVTEKLPEQYSDKNMLIRDLGWHMSCLSGLVFSRDCIKDADFSDFYGTGFAHIGAALSYLGRKEKINVRWLDKILVTTLRTDNDFPSWYKQLLLVFGENWLNVIISLPVQYTAESKLIAARSLWEKSPIISLKALLLSRAFGFLKFSDVKKYHRSLTVLTGNKIVFVYLISIVPKILIHKPLLLVFNLYMEKRKKESLILKDEILS